MQPQNLTTARARVLKVDPRAKNFTLPGGGILFLPTIVEDAGRPPTTFKRKVKLVSQRMPRSKEV